MMKAALTTMSVPYALFFMAGMFDWYIEDGLAVLLSFAMLVGLIWGWIAEVKRK